MKKKENKTPTDGNDERAANPYFLNGMIAYKDNSVVTKTIIRSLLATICVMSFDKGEGRTENTSPFDSFSHVLEGKAEIVIDNVSHFLESGQGILIPAHSPNYIRPNGRFKMIVTTI